ncbi:asparaginase domain-containing protein [Acinetobacter piscicola]|uniref:asparaginase domain-containing protein n=1 Tax=Acinetobacter piscicola TaxID=2006115 RepID=UPI001020C8D1|nr:asparaginase domain-containing protein [Acinetobacter piscicola]RYL29699.1 asparaginase [Acinetobacter piscicola]
MNKKIALIYMGGTFGCIGEPLAPMPETEFIPKLEKVLPSHLQIECFKAPAILDSSACTAQVWLKLIQQIQNLQHAFEYFVVIHGTDTLSYAAAVLSRFLADSCTVILTGSQYPLLDTQGDGIRELSDAMDNLNTALENLTKVPSGVYLAFYHQVFYARTALKFHGTALDAFHGQKVENLQKNIFPSQNQAYIIDQVDIEKAQQLNILNWMILPIEQQQLENNLATLLHKPPHFLILQAYGVGNLAVNATIIQYLKRLKAHGCCVILSSQVPFGGLDQRYAVSQWIQDANILCSDAQSQADLYAKILKIYLQYPSSQQWHDHWYDHLNNQPE